MIGVEIEGIDAVEERLMKMARRIAHLDRAILHEVRDWETEDVHRKKPGAHRTQGGARVLFRQHSWYETKRSRLAARRKFYVGRTSTRAVLRVELIDKLIVRLDALMQDRLTW
jgi:hypothetical protein